MTLVALAMLADSGYAQSNDDRYVKWKQQQERLEAQRRQEQVWAEMRRQAAERARRDAETQRLRQAEQQRQAELRRRK